MMKYLVFVFAIVSFAVEAQEIVFPDRQHDFGNVKENDGPVDHTFIMINNSDRNLIIGEVRASCGCTTPGWTKDSIAPNDTAMITARFDPHGRPGDFRKSLVVYTNAHSGPVGLEISGSVIADDVSPGPFERFYTYDNKGVEVGEKDFMEFIKKLAAYVGAGHVAKLVIESSASHVPTHMYNSNQHLAEERAKALKKRIQGEMGKLGLQDKISFSRDAKVQGPSYKNDFIENKKEYEKFQYVRVSVVTP